MNTIQTVGRAETATASPVRIGLALGGGFARGIAHAGLLKVFERYRIPLHCITGISAGAIVAAACASGTPAAEIEQIGCSMRLGDVGRFKLSRLGFLSSKPMITFLKRLLKVHRFEEMRTPLGVIATDLCQGEPVAFSRSGSVFDPIRASCAYPGLFEPVRHGNSLLVDGAIGMGIPSLLARQLGATHVIAVTLPAGAPANPPSNMMQVLCRSFQVLQSRCEADWRVHTDHEITPDVRGVDWNAFGCGGALVKAGEAAAYKSLPVIQGWLAGSGTRRMPVHRAA